ncbi:hypothetical protein [Fictibacillus barbaricus]|nr:hypothetical protein [Fictibacillus barbaricus]
MDSYSKELFYLTTACMLNDNKVGNCIGTIQLERELNNFDVN